MYTNATMIDLLCTYTNPSRNDVMDKITRGIHTWIRDHLYFYIGCVKHTSVEYVQPNVVIVTIREHDCNFDTVVKYDKLNDNVIWFYVMPDAHIIDRQ